MNATRGEFSQPLARAEKRQHQLVEFLRRIEKHQMPGIGNYLGARINLPAVPGIHT